MTTPTETTENTTVKTSDKRQPAQHPDWWRQATVYQIYPRSFYDTDGDGLGDIPGITAKLPYLAALGVDAVWLSPFYPSALADGGYDVDDYRDVDPRLGTLDDFDAMVDRAHGLGIKVVVDLVPNHTSDRHAWFQEALRSPRGSRARERYIFREGRGENGEEPPSDWQSNFGGPAWHRVPDGQWYLHLYAPEQPDLNWENPEVREDFLHTLRFWSDRGVDGFRVDVAHGMAKDLSEPLRDLGDLVLDPLAGLPLDGSHPLRDRDEVHEIFREWRAVFNEYDPPRAAVAEAWVPTARRVRYADPEGLGQAFNFEFLRCPWSAERFRGVIDLELSTARESGSASTWVLSNHDVVRHPSRYSLPQDTDLNAWLLSDGRKPAPDAALGLRRARAATLLMLALPGSAYLYQGEELGLPEVADLPADALQDPKWAWTGHRNKGRDGCRVPLPWTADAPAYGFSTGEPWLPQPADGFAEHAAAAQEGVPGSTLELYRQALHLRRRMAADEALKWVSSEEDAVDGVLHFRRSGGWHCVTNFTDEARPLPSGQILVSSVPAAEMAAMAAVADGKLPPATTVWLQGD